MRLAIILLAQFAVLAANAASLQLAEFCQPFSGASNEIIWKASTRGIPPTVKIFKVVPTTYSPVMVSNLLQLADLTEQNRKRTIQSGVLGGKNVLTYENREGTRHLDLIPSEGTIALHKAGVIAGPKEVVIGVPDTNGAVAKVFDLLPLLGINKTEIATNMPGKPIPYTFLEQTDFHKDKATGKVVSNVISRGVSFYRQIDGIPVWGVAGIFAHFGNESKLSDLSVTWRMVKLREECPVPTSADFTARIRSGRALIRKEQAELAFKRLTISKVILYYWESDASKQQSAIYPFAVLEAKTDLQGENSEVQLFVPFANE
jgi:hypothetical protein